MKQQYNMNAIDGTLKYGKFDGMKKGWYLFFAIIDALVLVGMGCVVVVFMVMEYIETGEGVPMILLACFVLCFMCALAVWIFIICSTNEKCRNDIKLWLTDAVELEAYARKKEEIQPDNAIDNLFRLGVYKIRVEFKYDGVYYAYESRGGGTRFRSETGFHKIWKKYVNKKVRIMYSPQYKEVMILKPDKHVFKNNDAGKANEHPHSTIKSVDIRPEEVPPDDAPPSD